ncbi:hypothetical protein PQR36_25025 [Paraburkholderia nemoris]|uniref:hypothetical protein n=1 Tax=Paraburkholderia nemoris TaxID=2793076 RepID=UPI0038B89EAC
MNVATKSAEEFTSIADWERQYLPNGIAMDTNDFGTEVIDEDLVESVAKELSRPIERHLAKPATGRKGEPSRKRG